MTTHLDNKMQNDHYDHWQQKWLTVNGEVRLPACGSRSSKTTTNLKKVDCLKCLKTKSFRNKLTTIKEFQKMFDKTAQITHCGDKVTATFHYRDTKAAFRHGTYE